METYIQRSTFNMRAASLFDFTILIIFTLWQLQYLATTMLELCNLMDTPVEEQQMFQSVTCNVAASEDEMTGPGALSLDFINFVSQ